jgi:hypothetical protein
MLYELSFYLRPLLQIPCTLLCLLLTVYGGACCDACAPGVNCDVACLCMLAAPMASCPMFVFLGKTGMWVTVDISAPVLAMQALFAE